MPLIGATVGGSLGGKELALGVPSDEEEEGGENGVSVSVMNELPKGLVVGRVVEKSGHSFAISRLKVHVGANALGMFSVLPVGAFVKRRRNTQTCLRLASGPVLVSGLKGGVWIMTGGLESGGRSGTGGGNDGGGGGAPLERRCEIHVATLATVAVSEAAAVSRKMEFLLLWALKFAIDGISTVIVAILLGGSWKRIDFYCRC